MQTKYFSPSINILRDIDSDLAYIPTRNGENAFNKIVSAYQQGTKSFNIIGAYGSGKSAFVLAFEKVLNKKASYFPNPLNGEVKGYKPLFIVGEYKSFKSSFCESIGLNSDKNIFTQLDGKLKKSQGLLLVVDEFGKFLEYAAKENPEDELYFIQQLAEFVNTPNRNIFFITTLHQAFEDYALSLSKPQKKEWDKVKGRLIEITFNEPVEQLLFLASERIVQKGIKAEYTPAKQKQLFNAISKADAFPLKDYFTQEFAEKLFPFDILSASIVTMAFQDYGQNERSLFSFLESNDFLALNDFKDGDQFYSIANVYDYLIYNFHSLLSSSYNPHPVQWRSIKEAIERTESELNSKVVEALKLVKTIGLLSIFGRAGQKINKVFLTTYAKVALGIKSPEEIIDILENKQIIRYRRYNQRYILFKGTDFDINSELELAESAISSDIGIVKQLNDHFNFPIVQAKQAFYEKGTPRYFVFELSEDITEKQPEGAIDGYINIVFNKIGDETKLKSLSEENNEAILFGFYQETDTLKRYLLDIQKIEHVKTKCENDAVATQELDNQLLYAKEKLNQIFIESFYGDNAKVHWYYNGKGIVLKNEKQLNKKLSEICNRVYSKTPVLRNELMNREKPNATISAAKNKLMVHALENEQQKILGFEEDKFPPEKSIYLSLLYNTGIHRELDSKFGFHEPLEDSFIELWNFSQDFLESCTISPRRLDEFIKLLKSKPFKLKTGVIEFWAPLFLIMRQQHFALYEEDRFVPNITGDTIEVAMKQPRKYQISYFKLAETKLEIFNKYRYFLNQVQEDAPTRDTFIETIKPFLSFYKSLVPYTQNSKKHLSIEALRLKEALTNATKPERVFFEDIPRALGYSTSDLVNDKRIEEFTIRLHNATSELSSAFSNLLNRIESAINSAIGNDDLLFPNNKLALQERFKKVKQERVNTKLKVLLQRINTPLDDRQSWLNSIATAVVNKMPDKFSDEDEKTFESLFAQYIGDLDNLTDISKSDIDEEKEEVLKLELTSFVKGVQKRLIRLPKEKSKAIDNKRKVIEELLYSDDKQANIVLLLKLLQKEIENE
ncbi:hypothetical protein [Maribellus sediminis]|uniref:hypothetical protein n=1 Tax=Maribellus sediminis TaxID=2696285 RepID=UPI00143114DA|nr:hypothetical protein [Maribellus sediminis]